MRKVLTPAVLLLWTVLLSCNGLIVATAYYASWITITGHHGIVLQLDASSFSSSQVRYVPFRSQYVVLALFALLGCWYIVRPH